VPKPIRRVHALTNTFSGVAGEARVAAEFVRCGLRVAKPYWTDDEADLILIDRGSNGLLLPVIVQVKAIQFLPDRQGQVPPRVYIQGLKKRYILKSPAFALALYRVDEDLIYLIPGPENVVAVYEAQRSFNPKHTAFPDLSEEDDVRLALDWADQLLSAWKVDRKNARSVSEPIQRLVKDIQKDTAMVNEAIAAIWSVRPNVDTEFLEADTVDEGHL
jgi:hypothetical protein